MTTWAKDTFAIHFGVCPAVKAGRPCLSCDQLDQEAEVATCEEGISMNFAAAASFRAAGAAGDVDPEPFEGEASAVEECGADNERLLWAGWNFDLCHRPAGHPGFHHHMRLP